MQPNWGLLGGNNNALLLAQQGFQTGQQTARQRALDNALRGISENPDDAEALSMLWRIDPRLAATVEDQNFQRSERARLSEGRQAQADFLLGTGNESPTATLLGGSSPAGAPPQQNALAGSQQNALTAPSARTQQMIPPGFQDTDPNSPPQAPQEAGRSAWERAVRADPSGSVQLRQRMAQMTDQEVQAYSSINARAIQELHGARDQESWEAGLARMEQTFARFGLGAPELPREFSPEVRDNAIRTTLQAKDLLADERADRRLEWDIEDDQIDNEALADYRSEAIRVRERDQDIDSSDRRYGIERSSEDRRYGIDRASRDRRRNADVRDRERRDRVNRAPTPSTVLGHIQNKIANGQPITRGEQIILDMSQNRGRRSRRDRALPPPAAR